jgi:DNA-binding protein YbaB
VERPQWSAITSMIGDLRQTLAEAGQAQRQMLQVTGVAWSDDRLIRAVVGPRGQLIDLEIDPRVYRTPDARQLSASILATVRAAVADAALKTREILDKAMPRDHGEDLIGPSPLDRLVTSHDADLPRVFREEGA